MKDHLWKIIAIVGALILIANVIYFGIEMHNINNEDTSFFRAMKLIHGEEGYHQVLPTYTSLAKHGAISGFGYRTIFIVGVTVLGIVLTKYSDRKLDKPVVLLLMKVLFFFTYLIGLAFIGNQVTDYISRGLEFAVFVGSVFVFISSLILAQVTVMYINR